ncbi:PPE domain-containing protein [Actinophytocola sp.]|uniref:PPE domain-containing protein n=1 Tax=Actinophytocola sp. TaxID=1872138 RepID=UPI002ED38181
MGHRWRGYEHPELYTMINAGPGAAASDPQTTYWQNLEKELTEVDEELNTKLANLGSRWEGKAAESAQTGLTPLASWASDAQTGAYVMKTSSEFQGEYVSDARARMPEPVEVTTPAPSGWDIAGAAAASVLGFNGPAMNVIQQAADHEAQEAAKNEAELRAIETMQTYESSSTWNRDTLGTFVAPPDVVVSTPAPQGGAALVGGLSATAVNGVGSDSGGSGSVDRQTVTTQQNGPVTPPSVNTDLPTVDTDVDGGGGGGAVTPPTLPPGGGSTTPADVFVPPPGGAPPVNPLPTTGGPGPNANPFLPGGGPFPSLGGGGENASDVVRRAMPLRPMPLEGGPFGRGMPGGLGGAVDGERVPSQLGRGGAIGETVVRTGPGAANAAGRGGAAAGAAGRRAEDEEDEEHFAADYLLEPDDVFGDDRHVSPMVIGE